jgi:hypothetical protein
MKMRLRRLFAVIITAFAAGACTPESIRHLPENLRIPADARLIGQWRAQVLGNQHEATVTAGDDDTLVVALRSATIPSAGAAPWETRHVLSFLDVNGTRVIAEHGPGMVDGNPVYRYATYDVGTDGAVILRYASQAEFSRYILSLRLQAEIRSHGSVFYDFLMTAYADEILRVLRAVPPARMYDVSFGPFVRQ